MKRIDLLLVIVAVMTATTAAHASAAPTFNGKNCTGVILSGATPEDFHHGAEADRAVPQAEDGRGEEITAFTSIFAGCRGL